MDKLPSLCLASVLIDDVGGDGLLLLLLPHQQDTLVDEHVLLLHQEKKLRVSVVSTGNGSPTSALLSVSTLVSGKAKLSVSPQSGPWTVGVSACRTPAPGYRRTRVL